MKAHKGAVIAAVVIAAATLAAILAGTPERSTPQWSAVPPPSQALLPFVWHPAPRPLPVLAFTDPAGTPASLADFAGGMVLVNLWATWCAPCLREMPTLDALAREVPDLTVIALNQDRGGIAVAGPFWEEHGFTALALYLDPGFAAAGALEARGLPITLFVDRNGNELARLEGIAAWDAPEVVAYFRAVVKEG